MDAAFYKGHILNMILFCIPRVIRFKTMTIRKFMFMVLSSWIVISLPSITPVLAEDADRKFSHKSVRLLQDRLARSFSEYDQLFSKVDIEKVRVTDEASGHYKCEISLQISASRIWWLPQAIVRRFHIA